MEKNNDRKHVILLTVLALVTMVVVVIGATFAYLASNLANNAEVLINAATEGGSDLLFINSGEAINIVANETNFYSGAGDLKATTTGDVQLSTNAESGSTHNFDVYVEAIDNDFEYSSGKCYKKIGTTVSYDTITTPAACKTAGHIWDKVTSKCYNVESNLVSGTQYTNELACNGAGYIWGVEEVPELVFNLYKNNGITASSSCSSGNVCIKDGNVTLDSTASACSTNGGSWIYSGVCVKADNTIDSTITTSASCTGTWVANKFENDMCYGLYATKDITTLAASEKENLITGYTLSATKTASNQVFFIGELKIVNFDHNQIVNGNKAFHGKLVIERNDAE